VASANVELVRSIYAAWQRGDFSSAEWADPEVEFVLADGPSGRETWTGLARLRQGYRDYLSAWHEYRVEADEFRELDRERVLVLVRRSGRGKTSGLDLGQMRTAGAAVFHLHEGKVTRLIAYGSRERALADLGLTPWRDSPAS
jgi:ketosteroid isomerase-like protein